MDEVLLGLLSAIITYLGGKEAIGRWRNRKGNPHNYGERLEDAIARLEDIRDTINIQRQEQQRYHEELVHAIEKAEGRLSGDIQHLGHEVETVRSRVEDIWHKVGGG